MIEKHSQESNNPCFKEYPVYQDLTLQLKELENRFAELTERKIEYETQINSFNSSYMLRLGGLIEEILKLRVTNFRKKTKLSEEARLNYEEFKNTFQQQLQDSPQLLDDSEKQQLKIAYRKASRLCHPDKLAEDAKAKGEEFFKALNEAYRHQDLERVQGILLKLESETTSFVTASKQLNSADLLQQKISLLYEQVATLELEIKCLQESEIYQRIHTIIDMDSYFSDLEQQLQAELKVLKGKVRRHQTRKATL